VESSRVNGNNPDTNMPKRPVVLAGLISHASWIGNFVARYGRSGLNVLIEVMIGGGQTHGARLSASFRPSRNVARWPKSDRGTDTYN
jgi:hypothetical protein